MSITTTPSMGLLVPTVGGESGPQYATDINTDLTIIDQHDHTPGNGVLLTSGSINVNADFSLNSNNLFLTRSVRFVPQSAAISGALDIGCIYVVGNELYYNDVSGGNQVAITNNGSVNAGAGSITGLPSGTAGVSYSAGTYTFVEATSTPADIVCGEIHLGNNLAGSNFVTLTPPSHLSNNYALFFPTALGGGAQQFLTYDNSGNGSWTVPDNSTLQVAGGQILVKAQGITNAQILNATILTGKIAANTILGSNIANATITGANIAAATVTRANQIGVGQQASSTINSINGSGSYATLATVNITTQGRPVMILLQAASPGSVANVGNNGASNTSPSSLAQNIATFKWVRSGTDIAQASVDSSLSPPGGVVAGTLNSPGVLVPPSTLNFLDAGVAGLPSTYTYALQSKVAFTGSALSAAIVNNCQIVVYEL